jgi:hypothetical protein
MSFFDQLTCSLVVWMRRGAFHSLVITSPKRYFQRFG